MDIQKVILVLCCAFSQYTFAQKASDILFDQNINLKPNQEYALELENVQAGDQIWTAVYLVAQQNYPGRTSKLDFVIQNQGLLNKAKPSEHAVTTSLVAEDLSQTHYFSFNQFKALKQWIESETDQKIEDPIVEETDTIRIYSQVNDWIPEYNSYEPTKVKIAYQNPIDFNIVAAYVVVGKGEKPAQLSELNFKDIQSATYTQSVSATRIASSQQLDFNSNHMNIKLIFLFSATLLFVFFAFVYRHKLRHRF